MMAAAAAGIDQPATTAAKIKTASHTKFLTVPDHLERHELPGFARRSWAWPPALAGRHALDVLA
jgi:hypothetical protein